MSCTRIQPYYPPKTQTQGVLNEVFTFSILFRFHDHINHQYIYSPTSIYIFSILISIYISWGADKENLLIIENFFSWWSFLLFSSNQTPYWPLQLPSSRNQMHESLEPIRKKTKTTIHWELPVTKWFPIITFCWMMPSCNSSWLKNITYPFFNTFSLNHSC